MKSEFLWIYLTAGFLVLTNIGTLFAIFKDKYKEAYTSGYKDAETKKEFERLDNKIDKAHDRIDKLKERLNESD